MNAYNGFPPEQRLRALTWYKKQVAAGRRSRPEFCMACGQERGLKDAHTEDYSEPFGENIGQFHLCYACHMMVHCRFSATFAFNGYSRLVEGRLHDHSPSAGTFCLAVPFVRRDYAQFRTRLLNARQQSAERFYRTDRPGVRPRLLTSIAAGRYAPGHHAAR